ncbi:MAG: peptidoglycan DD-metalloendopeptidase family protein [Lysobacterales bacterium]|jgi:lipoprotein NlpD
MGATLLLSTLVLLAGCAPAWAPVEERSSSRRSYELTSEGRYRVRRGDTLHAIAFSFGLDWRDLAAWNGIGSPYQIYPDQELRLSPPPVKASRPAASSPPPPRPVARKAQPDDTKPAPASDSAAPRSKPSPAPSSEPPKPRPQPSAADPGVWLWPTDGRLLSRFAANDPSRNGIEIGGVEGQPVIAAAGGKVVYSGNGLIGYGELIIIKHSDRLLSAYANNKRRLVSEGQTVAAGERIAEMGRNERNQAMLHFEIRVNGTPQDPLKFLPGR